MGVVNGAYNVTNNPRLADFTGRNYHLNQDSPCLNAGTNQDWMSSGIDLDERARIRYGIVDMGAYEHVYDGTVYMLR
jgi:predicted heme/steroid binding protein